MSTFVERFIKRPPVLFPLVALFHIAMLVFSIYNASSEPLSSKIWLQPLWMLGYTLAWLPVWAMKKIGSYLYAGMVVLSLVVHFTVGNVLYHNGMFLIDIPFAMIAIAYIKRFS